MIHVMYPNCIRVFDIMIPVEALQVFSSLGCFITQIDTVGKRGYYSHFMGSFTRNVDIKIDMYKSPTFFRKMNK